NRNVKLSIFIRNGERRNCCAAESIGLAIAFAVQVINIRTILFSVYGRNEHMLRIVKKLGLEQKLPVHVYELSEQLISTTLKKLAKLEA
ncbi:MAG: hypothetical protein WCP15_02860, partial [bacterium]